MKQQNIINLAITAAGGRKELAASLGISPWTISGWQRNRWMPPERIRPVCSLGGNLVTPDQVLAYIETVKAPMDAERAAT